MTEKGNGRCVGSDSPLRFGDHGCALLNCVIEFAPTVVAVDSHTEVVAGRNVGRFGWVTVDLDRVDPALLESLIRDAWRRTAPKKLAAAFEQGGPAA